MGIHLQETAKKLYFYAYKICDRNKDDETAQNFLIKSLQCQKGSGSFDIEEVSRALLNAIRADKIDTERLYHLSLIPAVKSMAHVEDSKYRDLYRLFNILLRGNTEDFFEF